MTLKNITLDDSTYDTQKALSLTNSSVTLKNNSTLSANNLNLTNMKNANFSVQNSNIKAKILTTNNSTLDLKSLNLKELESIEAKGSSTLSLNTWDTDKIDKLKTDESSKFVFDDLKFNLSNGSKTVGANVKLMTSLTLENITLANNAVADEFKLNTLKFEKTLTFADALKININFADALKDKIANIDYDKEYEILTATRIESEKTPYIKFDDKGLYATSSLSNNTIKINFTKENPTDQKSLSSLSNNINNDLLSAIIAHSKSEAGKELANEIEQIGYTQDSKLLNKLLVKTQNELKTIGKSSKSQISDTILLSNNMNINQRLSHIKLTPKLTMQNAFKYALASGESDTKSSLANVMDAIEADRAKNSFWYNVDGGYLNKNNGGDVKFYGTSIGYDRAYDLNNASVIYGVMFGINKAKYKNKDYNDVAKSYSVGIYADYESTNNHELQTNLNLAYIRSNKNFVMLGEAQNAKNNGYGVLLSTYYKYRFDLPLNGAFSHSVKPVVLAQVGHNNVGAFSSKHYKQAKTKSSNISLGMGAEYAIVNENQAHTIQAILKKNVYQTDENAKVNLSNVNSHIEYDIKDKPLSYELNYIGETRLNDSFVLQYAVGAIADVKGSYGGKGSVKLEYKF